MLSMYIIVASRSENMLDVITTREGLFALFADLSP
jgi:hypothetical protein